MFRQQLYSRIRPDIHRNVLSNLNIASRTSVERTYIPQTEGVEEIVQWLLMENFMVPCGDNLKVLTLDGKSSIDTIKTVSKLKDYGKKEIEKYVTKFVDGGGIPQSFSSINQLAISFEDDDNLITAEI